MMEISIDGFLSGLRSPDRSVVSDAERGLRALNRPEVIAILRNRLSHVDPEVTCTAAEALMKVCGSDGLQFILPLLADHNSTVRWCAAGICHDFGDSRAVPALIRLIASDPEPDVRLVAAHALGRIADPTALDTLRAAAAHDSGEDFEGRKVASAASEAVEQIESSMRMP